MQEGYAKGFADGVNHKRSIITLEQEESIPSDFAGFSDQAEQEVIAALVGTIEYKECFRKNLLRQSIMKHRQARLLLDNTVAMGLMHNIGNFISDLVVFYDNASKYGKPEQTVNEHADHGYDEID